ncbi:4Fe-4S dicluster domain-containing protein [Natranaerobius thermophilus]|uniref:4Fe-4S ferredoxin iron-sulfur binding domain protein n=1 Tax=Natranaerobius thermophilus (strain ATCC BAA-1301 / DSM 18059 / JW/NM-WN-LF) TaxID=457570 RepID=B2A732_NATTJ|nr:4Fe-4S dicluster domain-containing protein [Natranaerobius thermophilus]ACB85623.1 4Fe-4S ferredoxin iron-sulfur binding domain protein [Natranaerobius thermophilus JW/NM-WN-LF]
MAIRKLIASFDLCTGCEICTLVCSRRLAGGYNPRFARLRLESKMDALVSDPIVCNQCDNAFCEKVCPVSAIKRENGIPVVVQDECIGCGQCQKYCPRDVIVMMDKKASKCDLCGGDPLCVKNCPTGALTYCDHGDCDHGESGEKRGEVK